MKFWRDPLLRPLAIFSAIGLAIFIFVTVGRFWEDVQPENFVAQVAPSIDYELNQGAACDELFLNQDGKLFSVYLRLKKILIIDAATGSVEKQIELNKRFRSVSQLLTGGKMYYFLNNTDILVVNPDTAEVIAHFSDPRGRYYGELVQSDGQGRLIATDLVNSSVSVIEAETGAVVARRRISSLRGVLVGDGVIHYWVRGLNIHTADPNTLKDIWAYGEDYTRGSANIAYSNGELYHNDYDVTRVFDSKTGLLLREFPHEVSRIVVVGDRLFSWRAGAGAYCHQRGVKVWENIFRCIDLIMVDDHLFTQSAPAGAIAKLTSADGTRVYETNWGERTLDTIVLAERFDVIQDTRGRVSLVNGTTGQELWRSARPPRNKPAPWVVVNGHLILSNGRGGIISYNLEGVRP